MKFQGPSKKEERVIQFIKDFGESLGLTTMVDEVGNVIIKKAATAGMENRQTIVMQSHLDMVHQKNADTDFDFDTQGIQMIIEDDWIKADGTTLGADNGIGVASIMALLSSTDIPHPPIEALFTIDEETGMTGAMGLKGDLLDGSIMLNLDTEDDHELTIGCAGGIDVTATGVYIQESLPPDMQGFQLSVMGLTGGHSGMDIHKGRGNANKLMNRILYQAANQFGLRITAIDGGSLRNAIPRESFATVALPNEQAEAFKHFMAEQKNIITAEYLTTDGDMQVLCETTEAPKYLAEAGLQSKLLRAVYACPNGIYRMSPDIEDLVQTSNNLARVLVKKWDLQFAMPDPQFCGQ